MIGTFSNWLDQRTGYRKFVNLMLIEHIPGGAKWRYVWGSCLMFVFMIQLVTGVLLMTAYAPSDTSAWGSVYFIQYEMDFGWLIRGLHHYGSQTMVVLLAVHMLQVVIAGAHLPPREVNWWLGLMLMGVILGLSLTGYLLPWDQKGFFATQVATNIAQSLPGVGSWLQRFLVGGPEYGNATLTRFFTLHVWVLPFTAIILIVLHLVAFRRHGVTHPKKPQGTGWFYPDQAFRDLIVCLIIFGIMVSLVVFGGHGNRIDRPADAPEMSFYDYWAHAGQRGLGANLDAPADPSTEGYPARPEWYFLFLFQLLKYFKGDLVLVGTVAIPNGAMALLFLLPLLGYGRMRKFGHWFGVFVVVCLIGGAAALTVLAIGDDRPEPLPFGIGGERSAEKVKEAETFQHKLHDAERDARRAVNLAAAGIPVEGARAMVRNDPLGRGPRKFEAYCGGCHSYTPADKTVWFSDPKGKYTAADLAGFGSAEWIRALLKNPGDDRFFGRTKLTGMQEWRETIDDARKEWMEEDKESAAKKIAEQEAEFDAVAKFLSRHPLPKNVDDKGNEEKKDAEYEAGFAAFVKHCRSCHKFGDAGGKKGPNLTDYGSTEWIRRMVMSPQHVYQKHNAMPAFRDFSGPGGDVLSREWGELYNKDGAGLAPIQLDAVDRELIVRWLGGDHRAVFGGGPISGPVRKTKD